MRLRRSLDLTRAHLPLLQARLARLRPDSRPAWGRMDAASMCAHLAVVVGAVARGEQLAPARGGWMSTRLGRWLVVEVLPWPKGVKVPGALLPAPQGDVAAERARLVAAMEEFVAAAEREPGRIVVHPTFGALTLRAWERLHGVHLAHHFRQFGV